MTWIINNGLKWLMFLILVLANLYILIRGLHFLESFHFSFGNIWFRIFVITLFCILNLLLLSKLVIDQKPFLYFIHRIGNAWLGFLIELLTLSILADVLAWIVCWIGNRHSIEFIHNKNIIGLVLLLVITLSLSLCIYGSKHARDFKTNSYSISIDKDGGNVKQLKVVLLADLHLGHSIGLEEVTEIVKIVNSCQPDIVFVAGDIIDNDFDAIENRKKIEKEFQSMKSTYGTYAVWGNHDVEETLIGGFTIENDKDAKWDTRTVSFLKDCGFTMLEDESVLIDNSFYVVGVLDPHKPGNGLSTTKSIDELLNGLDCSKPIFELTHEPVHLKEISNKGIDVSFAGHTHGGQFFPLTLVQPLKWENYWGMKKIGHMYSFVTSGIGVYGPDMRIGSDAEVMSITISFES